MQLVTPGKRYFNNLDATRFYSFLHIFTNHIIFSNSPLILNSTLYLFVKNYIARGFFGIDYFFVLSSFLITWIIFEEQKRSGSFNILYFAIRRCLRLWPLYFLVVIAGFIAVYVVAPYFGRESAALPPFYNFLFFTLNFYIINQGDNFLFFLVFFWSIAIEEQFYLCWALLLKFFKKYFLFFCFLLLLSSLLFRYFHLNDERSLVYHTVSLFGNFSVGALLAYFCFHPSRALEYFKKLPRSIIALVYLVFILNVIFYNSWYNFTYTIVFERLIFALFFAFIIFEQEFCEHSFFKLGKVKFINYLGNISFGLYCFHGIAITILITLSEKFPQLCDTNTEVYIVNPIVIMAITIVLSIVSYEYFEKNMLNLKNKFYPKTQ